MSRLPVPGEIAEGRLPASRYLSADAPAQRQSQVVAGMAPAKNQPQEVAAAACDLETDSLWYKYNGIHNTSCERCLQELRQFSY